MRKKEPSHRFSSGGRVDFVSYQQVQQHLYHQLFGVGGMYPQTQLPCPTHFQPLSRGTGEPKRSHR